MQQLFINYIMVPDAVIVALQFIAAGQAAVKRRDFIIVLRGSISG
jgi:hypothetical protein